MLAATILFIATNAGVIGASRITYSMASYRQLPEIFRRLHPQFKTPWLSLVVFAGIAPILLLLPGDVNFVGTLYSLGATLSFTVAHASLVRLRMTDAATTSIAVPRRDRTSARRRRLAAVRDLRRDRDGRFVPRDRRPEPGHALGRARLDRRRARRVRDLPAPVRPRGAARDGQGAAGVRAGARARVPAILVPIVPGRPSDDAFDVACRLAAERGARIIALTVLEVPLDLPLDAELPELEAAANRELDEAVAIGDSLRRPRDAALVRGRSAGAEIVAEAERRDAEIIVLGSPAQDADGAPARQCSAPPSTACSGTRPAA